MSDPFKIDGPAYISLSGGRSSGYMLHRVLQAWGGQLPADVPALFANTGKEQEETLRFVRDIGERWGVPITWLEFVSRKEGGQFKVVTFDTASRNGEPFDTMIAERKFLPNVVMRFCTEELKVKTMERYLRTIGLGDAEAVVGIRADEPHRLVKLREGRLLPMVQAGVRKGHVHAFWRAQPFDLDLPYEDGHGNCDLCFLKGPDIVWARVKEKPTRAVWWAAKEEAAGGTFSKDRPSYATLLHFAQDQMSLDMGQGDSIPCFCGD